jgi:hypothetical protein
VQSPHTNANLRAGVPERDGVTLMSKVFDAVKKAELSAAERRHVADAVTPNVVVASADAVVQSAKPNASLSQSQKELFHHYTKPGGGVFQAMAGLIRRTWPRKALSEGAGSIFGDFGENLESAAKSPFWQWFHLEQTDEKNGVHRFQLSASPFRSLCYLDMTVSSKNEMRALTLGVQRTFISGAGEPFARDLVRSFLCVLFPKEKSEAISRFVDELGTEFGGSRPAVAEEARRPAPTGAPSSLYLVFLGQGKRCVTELGALMLEQENVAEDSTRWLCLRVSPQSNARKKRSGKSAL